LIQHFLAHFMAIFWTQQIIDRIAKRLIVKPFNRDTQTSADQLFGADILAGCFG